MQVEDNATQTGDSEAVSTPEASIEAESPSARDSINNAFAKLEAVEEARPNETNQAAEVLKNGKGADEKALADNDKAAADAKKGIEKAQKDAAKPEKEPVKADDKTESKDAKPTDAKEAKEPVKSKYEAPSRFSEDAKKSWDDAPEPVKAEVDRALKEMQKGLEKYKGNSDQWSKIAEYAEAAKEYGVELPDMIKNYSSVDKMLRNDIVGGLEQAAKMHGYTLEQIAEHVLNTSPEARKAQQTYSQQQQKIAELQQRLDRQARAQQQTVAQQNQAVIDRFAQENPRFTELEGDIGKILRSGLIERTGNPMLDLQAAYERADRLNPLPPVSEPQATAQVEPQPAQTRKSGISISGAPSSGSNPANTKPVPKSAKDAVNDAFAALGL